MLDVLQVLKAFQDNPVLYNLFGLPIAAVLIWAMLKGQRDARPAPEPQALPPWGNPSAVYFQGPIQAALDELRGIRHGIERLSQDQAAQTHDHNEHMRAIRNTLERVENRSARWARRNGDTD